MILIEGVDALNPGAYIVNDPAGDYFSAPGKSHYGSGRSGYGVSYPKSWVLAYTTGRRFLALGEPPANDPVTFAVTDGATQTASSPGTMYVQDSAGRRSGWIDGNPVNKIPDAEVDQGPLWSVGVGSLDPDVLDEPDGGDPPVSRTVSITDPQPGTTLHLGGASSADYDVMTDAWSGEQARPREAGRAGARRGRSDQLRDARSGDQRPPVEHGASTTRLTPQRRRRRLRRRRRRRRAEEQRPPKRCISAMTKTR